MTAHASVKLPSTVVTVIVALPACTPTTRPAALTVATELSLVNHVTFWLVALEGAIVADNCSLPPTATVAAVLFKLTPVTNTHVAETATSQVAVKFPSAVFTVIVALPALTAVTVPSVPTVAIELALVNQVTFLLVAVEGNTVANNCSALPPTQMAVLDLF